MKRAEFERLLIASSQAERAGGVEALPESIATVVMVSTVQSRIDWHGGLLCFFEHDFEGRPPYEHFAAAYRRIGADAAADALDRAVSLFPFEAPHLHPDKRIAWLEEVRESEDHELWSLGDEFMENPEVWARLKAYVEAHREAFQSM